MCRKTVYVLDSNTTNVYDYGAGSTGIVILFAAQFLSRGPIQDDIVLSAT